MFELCWDPKDEDPKDQEDPMDKEDPMDLKDDEMLGLEIGAAAHQVVAKACKSHQQVKRPDPDLRRLHPRINPLRYAGTRDDSWVPRSPGVCMYSLDSQ